MVPSTPPHCVCPGPGLGLDFISRLAFSTSHCCFRHLVSSVLQSCNPYLYPCTFLLTCVRHESGLAVEAASIWWAAQLLDRGRLARSITRSIIYVSNYSVCMALSSPSLGRICSSEPEAHSQRGKRTIVSGCLLAQHIIDFHFRPPRERRGG